MKQINRLTKADYNDIFSLSQFAFQYELSESELLKKQEEAERHIIWGWKEDEQLAAKLHLIPLSCYLNGKEIKMGGISSVATWPEYRRKGMVKHLLKHSLEYMKENGYLLSFLHPFSFSFYRKFGWEHSFNEQHYSIPIQLFKKKWKTEGYVKRIDRDIPLLDRLYTAYGKNYNGMLIRDEKWWNQRVMKDPFLQIVVSYNQDGEPNGYLVYKAMKNIFKVTEIVHTELNGLKALLKFIGNHDSMVEKVNLVVPENHMLPLLLDDPRFEQKLSPYFMARIVDVEAFLNEYPFLQMDEGESLTLNVEDAFLPDNNGSYTLTRQNVQREDGENAIHCSIQILTAMLLGFKRPQEYYEAGLLHGSYETVMLLEKIIPIRQTFFADFY